MENQLHTNCDITLCKILVNILKCSILYRWIKHQELLTKNSKHKMKQYNYDISKQRGSEVLHITHEPRFVTMHIVVELGNRS